MSSRESRGTTDNEWSDAEERAAHREVLFRKKVEAGAAACARGDYKTALRLYAETIRLDPSNHVLYSNRSAILCKLERFEEALRDAEKAHQLSPGWVKAFYRKGHALKCMGDYVKASLTYAAGLAEDPKNVQLLAGLVDCAMNSPMKDRFSAVYEELKSLNLNGSSFVIVSVVGQELLASDKTTEAIEILESALKVGTTSLKLRQSVLSSLSSAYWKLGNLGMAVKFMQQDLAVATSLGDIMGEARAHSNLGMVYISLGKESEALNHHRHQLALSLKIGDQKSAASVLSTLGQLYFRLMDYNNALVSHQQCLEILKNLPIEDSGGPMEMGRQLYGMGQIYAARKELEPAEECLKQHLAMAKRQKDKSEEAKALAALGGIYQRQTRPEQAMRNLLDALRCARDDKDRSLEAAVCGQLTGVYRNGGNMEKAKLWAEKQLQIALALKDKSLEAAALGNLGLVFQAWGNIENAQRLHMRQLQLAEEEKDKRGILQAHRNVGSCLYALNKPEESLQYHKSELNLCKELGDRASEGAAHGSLAAIYGKLEKRENALTHLQCHWNLAKETNDLEGQSEALSNIGAFLIEDGQYEEGLNYLERFLMLAQEENNLESERRACNQLGGAHKEIEQFKEAGRYFDQELALAKDLRDHGAMAKAYEALGEVHLALGQLDEAMECEKYHLALAHISSDMEGKLKAMSQIGNILLRRGNAASATKVFGKALNLARATKNKSAEAEAFGNLGAAYNANGRSDKALAFLSQELATCEGVKDIQGQYRAYGHIGEHYRSLRKVTFAVKAFEDQAELGRRLGSPLMEAEALGRIGLTCIDSGLHEDALKSFEEQWKLLEKNCAKKPSRKIQKMALETLWQLASCQENMGQSLGAIKAYERFLQEAEEDEMDSNCSKICASKRKLGDLWLKLGNYAKATECLEDAMTEMEGRVVDALVKSRTLRALACAWAARGARRQSMDLLKERLSFVKHVGLASEEGAALSDLGSIHRLVKEPDVAGNLFEKDLELSKSMSDTCGQCRALKQLGKTEEMQGNFAGAQQYYAWMLEAASGAGVGTEMAVARMEAHKLLGITCLALGDANAAVSHLEQALGLSASLNRAGTESEIRFAKSVLHWSLGNSQESMREIEAAIRLAEKWSGTAVWGDFLESGFKQSTLDTACAFQMCLYAEQHKSTEALLCVEKLSFWRSVALVEKFGAQIKKQKNQIPSPNKLAEALNRIVSEGDTILYYFQIADKFLFAWMVGKGDIKMVITRLHPEFDDKLRDDFFTSTNDENSDNNCSFSTLSAPFKWRLDSEALKTVLENRLAQLVAARETPPNICMPHLERLSAILVRPFKAELTEYAKCSSVAALKLLTVGLPEETEDMCVERLVSVLHLRAVARRLPALFLPNLGGGNSNLGALEIAPTRTFVGVLSDEISETERKIAENLHAEPQKLGEVVKNRFLAALNRSRAAHVTLGPGGEWAEFAPVEIQLEQLKMTSCEMVSLIGGNLGEMMEFGSTLILCGAKCVLIAKPGKSENLLDIWECITAKNQSVMQALEATDSAENVIVLGADGKLENGAWELGRALRMLLKTPEECRTAFRVIVHLVEKSLQRINTGQEHAMFTSEESVKKKMGPEAGGWKELLECLGFKSESTTSGASTSDSSIYFPIDDRQGNLARGSRVLQAFDGLPQNSLDAFSKMVDVDVLAIGKLARLLEGFSQQVSTMTAPQWETYIPLALYNTPGIQGLIASLGFDKLSEDQNRVTVKTIRMELTRRKVELANTCLHALFDDLLSQSHSNLPSPSSPTADSEIYGGLLSPGYPTNSSLGIRKELNRLRDLEITDFSGLDSDFYPEDSTGSLRRGKKMDLTGFTDLAFGGPNSGAFYGNKSGRRRGAGGKRRGSGPGGKDLAGYASESDMKRGRRKGDKRGYHSEDEGRLGEQEEEQINAINNDIMESTARVISVEERNSPLSDLGDSFHEDEGISMQLTSTQVTVHAVSTSMTHSQNRTVPVTGHIGNGEAGTLALHGHEYFRLETPAPSHQRVEPKQPPPPYKAPVLASKISTGSAANPRQVSTPSSPAYAAKVTEPSLGHIPQHHFPVRSPVYSAKVIAPGAVYTPPQVSAHSGIYGSNSSELQAAAAEMRSAAAKMLSPRKVAAQPAKVSALPPPYYARSSAQHGHQWSNGSNGSSGDTGNYMTPNNVRNSGNFGQLMPLAGQSQRNSLIGQNNGTVYGFAQSLTEERKPALT